MGLVQKHIISAFSTCFFVCFIMVNSEKEEVKQALVTFMEKLAPGNQQRDAMLGWNLTSDPCIGKWHGVSCYSENYYVKSIILEKSNLSGVVDSASLCLARFLQIISLKNNMIRGSISEDIGNCKSLTHLFLSGNKLSGKIPISVSKLGNLKRLHISDNFFTGELPNMAHVSGLISFLAENNNFTGEIPVFDFSNLEEFNVSNNNLQGHIPDVGGKFHVDSFYSNPKLCGKPLPNACAYPPSLPPYPMPHEMKRRKSFGDALYIYSGYIILGGVVLIFVAYKMISKFKTKQEAGKKEMGEETSGVNVIQTSNSSGSNSGNGIRSGYSMTTSESGMIKSSLIFLSSPVLKGLTFEDLLSCPAELVRRGNHGSLYKVMVDNGVFLAVKRIRDWEISRKDFQRRMELIEQAKHPRVLPPVAYYFSQQEKLLAYEYQQNGSLFTLLYGSQNGQYFGWGSRLNVAANIAEALAYMHEKLHESGIAHGNLKSSNIMFDKNMDPCISEYGLMVAENQDQSDISPNKSLTNQNRIADAVFKADIYAFGVILLELLTGKVVKNDGFDLVEWVKSVVTEEWSVEVFDKSLILQGASEEQMINLLQVALKCINPSPHDRPSMIQVAMITNSLKEEEKKSISFDS